MRESLPPWHAPQGGDDPLAGHVEPERARKRRHLRLADDQVDTTRAFDGKADAYGRNRFDYSPRAIDAIVAIAGLDKIPDCQVGA